MNEAYDQLLKVVDEDNMNEDGIYLTYYPSLSSKAEDWGVQGEELRQRLMDQYGVESVSGDFITLESAGTDGYLFDDPDTAYIEIMYVIKNEYRKYILK